MCRISERFALSGYRKTPKNFLYVVFGESPFPADLSARELARTDSIFYPSRSTAQLLGKLRNVNDISWRQGHDVHSNENS
jgi:hypothetical protein